MKSIFTQIVIGVVTSIVVTLVIDRIQEANARAPLPQPPVPGHDQV